MAAHAKPKLPPIGPSRESLRIVRKGVRSIRGAAEFIGKSISFVKELIRDGVLSSFLVGRNRVVPLIDLQRYLAEQLEQSVTNREGA